jgi:microcompartment protein CcmL/EutN
MKRSGKKNEQVRGLQKSAPETAVSRTQDPKEVGKTCSDVKRTGPGQFTVTVAGSLDEVLEDIRTPTGTRHDEIALRVIQQVQRSLVMPRPTDHDTCLVQAISTIAEMAPQNLTEALLATQMIATHEAALSSMASATRDDQTAEGRDANVLRATRLMRVFNEQLEAMQKLKGKAGQQKVTVEHVHVYEGGQAIVGTVEATKPGSGVGDGTKNG